MIMKSETKNKVNFTSILSSKTKNINLMKITFNY